MKNLLVRLLILLFPLALIYLGITYKDSFYYIVSAIVFVISILIIFPNVLSGNVLKMPSFKWEKPGLQKVKNINIRKKFKSKGLSTVSKLVIWLTILFSVIFTVIAIFFLKNNLSQNLILSYILGLYNFALGSKIPAVVTLITIVIIVFIILSKQKHYINLFLRALATLFTVSASILASVIFTFILIFVAAALELNVSAISSLTNIQNTGVITDQQKMIDKLKSMDKAPPIVPYAAGAKNKLLVLLINPNADYGTFYYARVVSSIPQFLTIPLNVPNNSVFMMGNILVVKSINPSEIEPLSPYIGYLMVKSYFGSRFIKSYPSVKVMGRQEYLDYRISEYNKIIDKINAYIQSITKEISGYYGRIQTDNNDIAGWQQGINNANSYKQIDYNNCISAGYYDYFTGNFIYYYSPSYCQQKASNDYDGYINQANQNIATLNQDITTINSFIAQDQVALNEAKGYIVAIQDAKNSTPQELGVFEPGSDIKVAVDETSPTAVVDFFEALSHEYLHYASYVNKDQVLKYNFFEEGLTETFARQVARKEFNVNTHIGYPVLVAIISQMMKKVPESTFEDIYFSKNEGELEAAITNAYGEKFYNDFSNYFDIIGYLPDKEALSLSNAMLLRMGSQPIQESDLYSSTDTSN